MSGSCAIADRPFGPFWVPREVRTSFSYLFRAQGKTPLAETYCREDKKERAGTEEEREEGTAAHSSSNSHSVGVFEARRLGSRLDAFPSVVRQYVLCRSSRLVFSATTCRVRASEQESDGKRHITAVSCGEEYQAIGRTCEHIISFSCLPQQVASVSYSVFLSPQTDGGPQE